MNKSFLYTKRHNLKNSANKRFLEFNLNRNQIQRLLSNPICHFCSTFCSLEITGGSSTTDSFTFERLNPLIGYVSDNVVVSCHQCNSKKSVMDQKIVLDWNQNNKYLLRNQ